METVWLRQCVIVCLHNTLKCRTKVSLTSSSGGLSSIHSSPPTTQLLIESGGADGGAEPFMYVDDAGEKAVSSMPYTSGVSGGAERDVSMAGVYPPDSSSCGITRGMGSDGAGPGGADMEVGVWRPVASGVDASD